MPPIRLIAGAVALALATATVAPVLRAAEPAAAAAPRNAAAQALHALFDADWQRQLRENPLLASYIGDDRYDDRLPDLTPAARAAQQAAVKASLARLQTIDRDALSAADRLSYDIYARLLGEQIEGFRFHPELMPVDQRGGVHVFADNALQVLQFTRAKDYTDWLARLRAYGTYVDQTIVLMREGMASGWTPPKAIMQRVPAQIDRQIVAKAEDSRYYAPFLKIDAAVPAREQAALRAQAQQAMTEIVLPALERFRRFFNDEYLPACADSVAAGDLPDGRAYYDYLARTFTTTTLSAEQIHAIGLKEVARIRAEMETLKDEVGFDGDLPAFFTHLRTDPKFFHSDPQALLTEYRAIAKRMDPELVKVFGKIPRTPYGVTPIPDAIAPDTTTAYYQPPATDGSRAGYYYVNLYKPESRPRWEMMALSLHEAVPGHHFQIALAQEQGEQPMFRRLSPFTAFVEGWGLYAERLGYDMGLYDDPYARMGQLAYDMWRAVRLVVDTGLHAKGWSRQQAIDYFQANAPKAELDIVNEIDRYLANPGQALAYKIGQMKISELRERAQRRLGDKFDLRAFHDALLADGALPLSVLESRMDAWVRGRAQQMP